MKNFKAVKGLECCQNYSECSKCPYNTGSADTDECKSECMKDAAELINEKQTEIERLQQKITELESKIAKSKKFLDMSRKVSLARRDSNLRIGELNLKLSEELKTTKSEAIKEFAEMLKRKEYNHPNTIGWVRSVEIDNLVKEMVGDAE